MVNAGGYVILGGGVWRDIITIGEELDRLGIEFSSSFEGVVGNGRDIRFWIDRWVGNTKLCDRFPRLYHLDRRKEGCVADKGSWANTGWRWEWDWVRNIRGRVCSDFEELLGVLQNIVISIDCRDKWRWTLNGDGDFSVKDLSRLVEEKILDVERGGQETIWNKLVPKKVNIFVWRVLKGRIPVREELDKRGIDLDSVLCPCCDSVVESCAHSLVLCDLARGVWEKIFSWWKVGNVNAFTIDELFSANGGVNVPSLSSRFWQAVIWTTGYYIWKERNARVFGKKISSVNKIVQGIQLKSYEWIVRRTKNKRVLDWHQWVRDPINCRYQDNIR
ncbi:reverse transcriptase domain, reverse transcriptase zinc-binding domain protein [Tanacetum coccineum]